METLRWTEPSRSPAIHGWATTTITVRPIEPDGTRVIAPTNLAHNPTTRAARCSLDQSREGTTWTREKQLTGTAHATTPPVSR
jgi:hypothetical protein